METNSKMSTWIVVGVIALVVVIVAVVLIAGKGGNPQTADVKQPKSPVPSKLYEKKKQVDSAKKVTPPTPTTQPADTTRQLPLPPPARR